MTLEELKPHLFSLPKQPDAIPYLTSYYRRSWGFCLTHNQLKRLKRGRYRAVIKSELKKGVLTYGDLVLPGKERKEILISTYVCHPSLANNELSGPVIATALAQWLSRMEDRRFTYRIYFGPETIGSIVYLSRHLDHLRTNLAAGYVVTCAGDTRCYSLLHSRYGDTLADRLTKHVMNRMVGEFIEYSFLDRGSDERQYCSPGVDLPVVSVMRSKYGAYPEYHTSLDDLDFISPSGLGGSLSVLKACLHCLEHNRTYRVVQPCEPQLGRRGLYPNLSAKSDYSRVRDMMNMLAYCDGRNDLAQIAEITGVDFLRLVRIAEKLWAAQVIEEVLAVDG
jgi:aminopeptidase-like protein